MSDKKYVVPEEGWTAAWCGYICEVMHKGPNYSKDTIPFDLVGLEARKKSVKEALEAFIRWQSENPRVPTSDQVQEMVAVFNGQSLVESDSLRSFLPIEWQRRMYLAPEPEVDRAVKAVEEAIGDCGLGYSLSSAKEIVAVVDNIRGDKLQVR
jgi:hypothetical protein